MASESNRKFALIAAILASSMAFIDATALNVALPAIQRGLDLTGAQLLWVVNSYTLMLASLMLSGGALGDILGKKKVFVSGIALFAVSSLGCAASPDGLWLIITRGLQGVGGALMVPGSLALISAVYPSQERGKAIGTWSMFSALTTILGPLVGGYLAGEGLWRAIFLLNIPLAAVSAFLLLRYVREPATTGGRRIDWVGMLLVTLGCTALVYGFIQAGEYGFNDMLNIAMIVVGFLLLILFAVWELKAESPMMPLDLFKAPTFSAANMLTLLVYGAMGTALFFLPLNLIEIQGYSEAMAGMAVLPFGGLIALMSRFSGRLTDRVGPRVPLVIGPVITGIGFILFSFIGITEGESEFWSTFFPVLAVAGIGMGFTVVPVTTAVMRCVSDQDTGIASGVNNTISRLANVLVLAAFGSLALILFEDYLFDQVPVGLLDSTQREFLQIAAADFAAAEPAGSWSEAVKERVNQSIDSSFIRIFNIISISTGILCWIGALIAAVFIKRSPQVVELHSDSPSDR